MDGERLLDTNAFVGLMKGEPARALRCKQPPPVVVDGRPRRTLLRRVSSASRSGENIARLDALLSRSEVICADARTAYKNTAALSPNCDERDAQFRKGICGLLPRPGGTTLY